MKKRIAWIDILKIIGMLGVVIIHITGNTIDTLGLSGTHATIYTILSKSCLFTLPLFVMVSGSLLLSKDISYKEIFSKYVKRMLFVLLTFGMLFAFMEEYYYTRTINVLLFKNMFLRVITGNLWAHMWYIYVIISLYLVTPIFRKYIKNSTNKEQIYLLIILYTFTIFRVDISNLIKIPLSFYIPLNGEFLFAYILGVYLYDTNLSKRVKHIIQIIAGISAIAIVLLTYYDVSTYLVECTSSLSIFVAAGIYVTFKGKEVKSNTCKNIIFELGKCSLGMYVIHQLFINILYKIIKFDFILSFPYIGLLLYGLGILSITFVVTYLLRKIKFVEANIL